MSLHRVEGLANFGFMKSLQTWNSLELARNPKAKNKMK